MYPSKADIYLMADQTVGVLNDIVSIQRFNSMECKVSLSKFFEKRIESSGILLHLKV